ncbi:MAG: hypothetical protein A2381_05465 [Bdellovibrionales bacterium RIFOXYB1_FULL_37_110]|nr:MAG: hypothetical protein A2181_03130 [Bdellovibrionales bacterium RIFOXYA1_FULL_38_20]OFZ46627.1 MAG: hypothetical protein A2417_14405 [Bdellovibrionales bacterium RIFOXYC1_FULL_37_79]OFZ57369.1 MAG: hypothetical protein A2381_05465 [Bdellovibrionales bacterium RIFOXYB1_FULL_37_110]OFZ62537.1 MAG: hypothetical protein A2577_08310 [Bdellovibrionales bacterium RIFOXYD1_FULL_36_51]
MSFPNKKELDQMRKKLENAEPVRLLPKDASNVDKLKFSLCKEIIIYLKIHKTTQVELANILEIDPARLSEIVKYKIDLFTVDRLLSLVEKLNPSIKVTVA